MQSIILYLDVLLYFYFFFFLADKNSKSSLKLSEAADNMLKTMALLSTVFCILTTPVTVWYLLYELQVEGFTLDSTFYHFTVIAMYCNCCVNPFLYSFKYREFQETAKILFRRCVGGQNRPDTNTSFVSTSMSSVP